MLASPPPVSAAASSHLRALDRMMAGLAAENARASATIRRVYRPHLDLLVLDAYADLAGALATGGLAPLPDNPRLFNLVPRLEGPHPIGEKDLRRQESYVAARPAAVGALLAIAARVRSGPIEVTSLVRHGEYQDALRATNANARTSVPTHTMGLAFDIALVNTPLPTVHEVRRVLREMRDRGDILFIGERRQLVFHVVPHPSRLGYFTDVYRRAVGAPPVRPRVVAEIVSFRLLPRDREMIETRVSVPRRESDSADSVRHVRAHRADDARLGARPGRGRRAAADAVGLRAGAHSW